MSTTASRVTPTGTMLLGSQDVRGGEGEVRAVDPRTGHELEPSFGLGGTTEVDRAANLAWDAFATLRATSAETRAALLDAIATEVEGLGDDLVHRVIAETGIVEARVRGELARTVNQLRLFGRVLREGSYLGARVDPAIPDRTPLPRPDLRQRKVPLGPVAVFAASNFPLAFSVAGGDTASALAAGCPVVVKAHSAHPGVSEMVGRAVRAAVQSQGLPEGTFSLLLGSGRGLGQALVTHPRIKAVGFTGSRSGGLALVDAAAQRSEPIPVYAEMSSINPVFILPGALAARGAEIGRSYVASVTTGTGQLCTSPGLVFVQDGEGVEEFLRAAGEAATDSVAQPMLSASICAAFDAGVEHLRSADGVTTLASGGSDPAIESAGGTWLFSTDGRTFRSNPTLQEEVFGAASLVVRVHDVHEMAQIAEELEGQLTATMHLDGSDHDAARRLLPELELLAGRIVVNGWPTGVEVGDAVVHGGPFPATSAPATTSVGTRAIERFLRIVSYQDMPDDLLPEELREGNPLGLWRRVDGELGKN